eukprot:Blabericola_migrator_1__8411@NODE_4381_length_1190_cov_38_741763_g2710_i0_p1_GENE_NODE_4381_length_1190_cov_38_741763_g2710_i0NODE_4381_length_1190_cov_38_741763_g2710_i0_p1_ORF_typecomplete_len111_score0_84_NODE_4381_length_1190_cov_38_741763_g2710_i0312644
MASPRRHMLQSSALESKPQPICITALNSFEHVGSNCIGLLGLLSFDNAACAITILKIPAGHIKIPQGLGMLMPPAPVKRVAKHPRLRMMLRYCDGSPEKYVQRLSLHVHE